MKKIFSRLIIAASAGLIALSGCKVFDSLESQDDPVIYSERIDGVTISTDSKEILAGASTTLTAAAESVHAKEDAISYAWSLSAGEEYATLSISGNTATLTANKDAPADSVVTVQCTANYDFGEKNSVSSEKSIDVIGKGNVNATWDLSLCGANTFVYYTDSDFTNEVKGAALTNKAAEAVSEGYFKPETTNANGKPYATLKGVNFTRAKLGGNGTALVGYADDLTSKNTSNLKWSHFKEKGSYLTLKLFGDSTVTITGGSVATDEYRGVFVYDAKGNEVASIRGKTTLTNVTFTGTLNDEFYIVGNSGGVSKITCFDENYDPYDAEIESVTVTAVSEEVTAGTTCTFSASIADTLNKDEVTYKWTIENGESYATLENDTAASCTLTVNADAPAGQTITVKCEVTYTHKEKESKKSSSTNVTVLSAGTKSKSTWDWTTEAPSWYADSTGSGTGTQIGTSNTNCSGYYFIPTTTGSVTAELIINGKVYYPTSGDSRNSLTAGTDAKSTGALSAATRITLTTAKECKVTIKGKGAAKYEAGEYRFVYLTATKATSGQVVSDIATDTSYLIAGAKSGTIEKSLAAGTYYIYFCGYGIESIVVEEE